jgi:hypothetical protein
MEDEHNLGVGRSDLAAVIAKGLVGAVPGIGAIAAEIVGAIIPNQRLDRIVEVLRRLDEKVRDLDRGMLNERMKRPESVDLLEDGLHQASRALSPERREYIASMLKNGLSKDDLTHIEQKKLLSILGELNDAEILLLKFYSLFPNEKRKFAEQHQELFLPVSVHLGSPQGDLDKAALGKSYKNKLIQMGLLRSADVGYDVNSLGSLLLRYIDLAQRQ